MEVSESGSRFPSSSFFRFVSRFARDCNCQHGVSNEIYWVYSSHGGQGLKGLNFVRCGTSNMFGLSADILPQGGRYIYLYIFIYRYIFISTSIYLFIDTYLYRPLDSVHHTGLMIVCLTFSSTNYFSS